MRRTAEILEGNETIRRLMADSLRALGVDVVERHNGDEPPEPSDLLVADVDSGVVVEERAAAYLDDDRVVVYCGLRDSRDRYPDERWVERPFTPYVFQSACADALGLEAVSPPSSEPSLDSGEDSDFDIDATAAIRPPPGMGKSAKTSEEPITRELDYDEAQALEQRLGLDPGVLQGSPEITLSDEDAFEVLDLDDSAVLVVDGLKFALGGKVRGDVESRRVETHELEAKREEEIRVRGTRSRTFNQTMPDTPHALNDSEPTDRDLQVTSSVGSDAAPTPLAPDVRSSPADSSLDEIAPAASGGDLQLQIKGVARMLAESWQRIALTSRTEDRADRIQRVLAAAVGKGLRGAAAEVQRIPPAIGFAGSLNSLTFVELVRTVRDRRLRGRLEVAVADEAFVLHMDGLYLEEIDALSGNVDGMLLDILHQGGALDDRTYDNLLDAFDSGQFLGPLELELARKQVVADATLQSARVVRARELFRRMCASRGGQFAFLEIRPGDHQPWPVDPLRVNVDQLLLELLREASIDTGDSQATASTHLQLDPNRAAALSPGRLTEEERHVMNFFRDGETLESARDRLQKQAGPEDVDRIVDRLKKVELLKRSDPTIDVPSKVEDAVRETPVSADEEAIKHSKRTGETVVSPVSDLLSKDERRTRENSEALDEGTDAEVDEDLEATSLAPNWDLIPDTGELDELIEEALDSEPRDSSDAEETQD